MRMAVAEMEETTAGTEEMVMGTGRILRELRETLLPHKGLRMTEKTIEMR